jgi:hypothetical protein
MEVKGTLILNYVKLIRGNKDRDWDKYLEPEDWKIINSKVLAASRYPYESFRRMGFAVFKEIANSDMEVVRGFGRFVVSSLFEVYSSLIFVPGNPLATIKKLAENKEIFLGGDSDTQVKEHGDDWALCKVVPPSQENDEERLEAFCYQHAGHLEELVEQAGGKNVRSTIKKKGRSFEILVKWE